MGQKVNALSLRQSNNKKWNSKSFVDRKNYSEILHQDLQIRSFVLKFFKNKQIFVNKCIIKRVDDSIFVNISLFGALKRGVGETLLEWLYRKESTIFSGDVLWKKNITCPIKNIILCPCCTARCAADVPAFHLCVFGIFLTLVPHCFGFL